jgi:hypothetical protein
MSAVAVKYTAPPTLWRFLQSSAFIRCIVGPVGSGKSSVCVMELVRRAREQAPGPDKVRRTRFAVIRNTYSQLRDTTRKTFEQWVPDALGKWHEQSFTFTMDFPLKDGTKVESEVLFRALDRPEDVKKLLSLELTGAYINEGREIPKSVFDVLQTRVGRFPSKIQGGPTWFGIWLDTNPWPTTHWGYKTFSEDKPKGHDLFEQPGGREANAENIENLPAGYYERLCEGKDAGWVEEYVDSKYPKNDRGSIYGHLVQGLKAKGNICDFDHPKDGVFISVDLGISDSFAIWWWRFSGQGVDFIDHYEATGEPLSHYFDVIESRGWEFTKIWLPHDARARTLQTGVSTQDRFTERYPNKTQIGPELYVADGIQASRWLLGQPGTRFHSRCSLVTGPTDLDGLEALQAYRYAWDEKKQCYSKEPVHDWASHTADAFRYGAIVVKYSELRSKKKEAEKKKPLARSPDSFTLDELWELNAPPSGARRI